MDFTGQPVGSGPSLEEVLWTIRDAWPPPRSLSVDSESICSPNCSMGTGYNATGGTNSRLSLPHRRYSVPETVMRKYSLSRKKSAESESTESGTATVPTPSILRASTENRPMNIKKNTATKACQTSPRSSLVSSVSFSSTFSKSAIKKQRDHNKRKANSLDETSSRDTEDSQLYFDANYMTTEKYKSEMLREVSLPGEVILQKEESSTTVTKSEDKLEDDVEHKVADVTNYIIEEDIKVLLEDITKDRTIKLLLGLRAKSFPERTETENLCDSKYKREIKSANGRLNKNEFKFKDTQSTGIDYDSRSPNMKDNSQFDDTPSPEIQESPPQENSVSPPKSGHSSESAECYMTDCDICNAEGRKCCSLDNSSEIFSFTSPDMVMTTNELRTSSEYNTTTVTLDQTVSDHSTSTQDSTLSITSITPESYNSSPNSSDTKIQFINNVERISPSSLGLVISSETSVTEPIRTKKSTKNLSFHLSESSESSDKTIIHSMPLVITSEFIVMEPVKCDTSKSHYVFEMTETESTVTDTSDQNIENTDAETVDTTNENKNEEERMYDSLEVTNNETETPLLNNEADKSNTKSTNKLKVINIFLNRNVGFRQSTGSAIIDENGTAHETVVRSMSCVELTNGMEYKDEINESSLHSDVEKVDELQQNGDETNMEEEGDLLEELGFKEDIKSDRTSSSFLELCGKKKELSYEEMCKKQVQDMFYGNRTYELITNNSTADTARRSIMGNVMSTSDESLKPYHFKKIQNLPRQDTEIDGSNVTFGNYSENDGRLSGYTIKQQDFSCDGKCNDKNNNESEEIICGNVIMLKIPLPPGEDGNPIAPCMEGTVIENTGQELIIPRYSAMPRTVSMLVNTSSADYSSDSELSLADSLEEAGSSEQPNSTEQSWTNKHDNRMVRGDVMSLLPEENSKKLKRRQSTEAYAYFVSLSGEMGEIKSETIPENLKQKLMKRDNEIRKHIDHSRYHHHHHPRRKEKKYESLFKRALRKKPPQLSQSEFYDSSSKEDATILRKAYSLTSGDSEEKLAGYDSKFTQWEEFPQPYQQPENKSKVVKKLDEEAVIKKLKKNKWMTCSKRLRTDPELDNAVSEVLLSSIEKDKRDLEIDEEIKDILLEALKDDEERAIEEKSCDSGKSDSTEEQVVPTAKSKMETENTTDESNETRNDEPEAKETNYKSISVQTNESTLHVATCEAFELCDLCQENNLKDGKCYNNVNKDLDNDIQEQLNTSKESMEKIDNLINKNLKPDYKDKLGGSSPMSLKKQRALDINIPQKKIVNYSKNLERTRYKPPYVSSADRSRVGFRSPRSHSCLNLNNKQPSRPHNVKAPPSRRSANTLGVKFQQKFEAIPEEKSGSMESSEEQLKSPKPGSSRRLSAPTDIILIEEDKTKKTIQRQKVNNMENVPPETSEPPTSEQPRRHTIHGNIHDIKEEPQRERNDQQSRRHTVHGNINLSTGLRRINLNVGSIMRGQVIGQSGNVMIGRFRPLNEETQIEKDENEKLLIGEIERIEKLRRKVYKGKEALETSKNEEQEELMTLSKGWINFYLLRESMDFESDHSFDDEGLVTVNETTRQVPVDTNAGKVTGKQEEKVHQYTVQISASEEPVTHHVSTDREKRLPDLNRISKSSPRSSSDSPEINLPGIPGPTPLISPSSTKSRSPTFSEISSVQHDGLPQLRTDKKPILKSSKLKSSARKYIESKDEGTNSPMNSDQEFNYIHLPSPHSEIQSRSPNTPCPELSPITPSSSTCDSRSESPVLPSIRWPARQIQRRHTHRYQRAESGRQRIPIPIHPVTQNPGTCWTVTVAGNSANPEQPPPDVEMRLSFQSGQQQNNHRQQSATQQQYIPIMNGNMTSQTQIIQDNKERRLRRAIQDPTETSTNPCWSLTVKNKNQGDEKDEQRSHYKSAKKSAKPVFSRKDSNTMEKREPKKRKESSPLSGLKLKRS